MRLLFLTSQVPVLGVLLAFVLGSGAFDSTSGSANREYLVAMVIAMTLIGVLNSVREIVQDRPVFHREFAVHVSSTAFVLSRWVVLTTITFVQSMIFVIVSSSRQVDPLGDGALSGSGSLELLASVAGIGVSSVGLRLVISAFVSDTQRRSSCFYW